MQKITPFLWFNHQAQEAMEFYTSLFNNSRIVSVKHYPESSSIEQLQNMQGKVLTGVFELEGQRFMALDGGPTFHFTPAISFFVHCDSQAEIDALWAKLSEEGSVLMPLQAYDFSQMFGWLADKYGVSWQLEFETPRAQKITPALLFTKKHAQAESALNFYGSLFKDFNTEMVLHYEGEHAGKLMYGMFQIQEQDFIAMDSDIEHGFTFNEAISFYVECDSQAEIDALWNKLSADPDAEMCGWLKDKYGISWQIIPSMLPTLMNDPNPEKANRVMNAIQAMKKIDIAQLQQAHGG
jgi:predicted 3-demethylubiquinone-9 3-methyltransferase (glyoxalase superfamily)